MRSTAKFSSGRKDGFPSVLTGRLQIQTLPRGADLRFLNHIDFAERHLGVVTDSQVEWISHSQHVQMRDLYKVPPGKTRPEIIVAIRFATNLLVPPSAQLGLVLKTHGFVQLRKSGYYRRTSFCAAKVDTAKRQATKNVLFGSVRTTPDKLFGGADGIKYGDMWLVFQKNETETAPSRGHMLDHIGWAVPDTNAAIASAKTRGYKVTIEPRSVPPMTIAFIEGPNGFAVELTQTGPAPAK